MLKLKPVMLQQHEDEGGEWQHEPNQSVRCVQDIDTSRWRLYGEDLLVMRIEQATV
jgi:hypothetical protein